VSRQSIKCQDYQKRKEDSVDMLDCRCRVSRELKNKNSELKRKQKKSKPRLENAKKIAVNFTDVMAITS